MPCVDQIHVPPQQVAGGPHAGWIDISLRRGAAGVGAGVLVVDDLAGGVENAQIHRYVVLACRSTPQ